MVRKANCPPANQHNMYLQIYIYIHSHGKWPVDICFIHGKQSCNSTLPKNKGVPLFSINPVGPLNQKFKLNPINTMSIVCTVCIMSYHIISYIISYHIIYHIVIPYCIVLYVYIYMYVYVCICNPSWNPAHHGYCCWLSYISTTRHASRPWWPVVHINWKLVVLDVDPQTMISKRIDS